MTKSKPAHKVKSASATKSPTESRQPSEVRPAQAAGELQAGRSHRPVAPAAGFDDSRHHEGHRLATAFGPWVLRGVVRKKLGLTLESEKPDGGDRVYRIVAGKSGKPKPKVDNPDRQVA